MKLSLFLYPVLAFALVALLMPLARKGAKALGFVDEPGGRKRHEGAVPPVGGLVIFPVFMLFGLIGVTLPQLWFYLALGVLLIMGALDDRVCVPPFVKFTIQWIAALIIIMPGCATVHHMGDLLGFGPINWGQAGGIIFSAVAAVLLINAINLMDGLDGLAGGEGFVALFWMAVCCLLSGHASEAFLPLLLMGALAGFLLHNMRHPWCRRARVFLGDSGSLSLGLSLGWFAMRLSQGGAPAIKPVTVAWFLALPIYDTCGQFVRRISQGRHPFDADHNHFHHHLINAGMPAGRATFVIVMLSFILGLIGIAGAWLNLPDYVMAYSWTALLLMHVYMSLRPHRFRRLVMRLRGKMTAAPEGRAAS